MRGVAKPRAERIPRDAYLTPAPLAFALVEAVGRGGYPDWVVDPCAGTGAFADAARARWPSASVFALDLGGGNTQQGDFLSYAPPPDSPPIDLIVGNPPYLLAEQFVRHALGLVRPSIGRVAFILRLSFLAGQRRLPLYGEHPLFQLWPVVPRPSFTADGGTDASEYALFVWQRGFRGLGAVMPAIRWR